MRYYSGLATIAQGFRSRILLSVQSFRGVSGLIGGIFSEGHVTSSRLTSLHVPWILLSTVDDVVVGQLSVLAVDR